MSLDAWLTIEALPAYFREGNPLTDASDYRAFIGQAVGQIHADAVRCYRKHGRGVVILGRPRGLFVEASYGLPRSGPGSGPATAYLRDLLQYDPAGELLAGAGGDGIHPARLWRLRVEDRLQAELWRDFDLTAK
jgi:hypothetical protein